MGLYDHVICEYDVGDPRAVEPGRVFQSKDTPEQFLATYKIDKDGRLWFLNGSQSLGEDVGEEGWRPVDFTGEIEMHDFIVDLHYPDSYSDGGWMSLQFWLRDGVVKDYVVNVTEPTAEALAKAAASWV